MNLRRIIVVAAAVMAVGMASGVGAAEFSADMIVKSPGFSTKGKVYVKGKRMRMEMGSPMGGKSITIIDQAKGVCLVCTPSTRSCFRTSSREAMGTMGMHWRRSRREAKVVELGRERLHGYLCRKLKIIHRNGSTSLLWVSERLGTALKSVEYTPEGEVVTELRNIKEQPVAESLVAIPPKGYTISSHMGPMMGPMRTVPSLPKGLKLPKGLRVPGM